MKTLLVNPKAKLSNVLVGLCYLSSSLKAAGFSKVSGIDLSLESNENFREQLKDTDIVGIHCTTTMLRPAFEAAQFVKSVNPRARIIMGGPHPTLLPDEIMANETVDAAVVGEGETTIVEIARRYEAGEDLEGVKGVHWRRNGEVIVNEPREFCNNLDQIPFPDRTMFRQENYGFSAFPVFATRSCAFKCANCMPALRTVAGPYRSRSIDNVLEEMLELKRVYGTDDITFWDNDISLNRKWLAQFCERLLEQGLTFRWDMQVRISSVGNDRDTVRLLRKAGCRRITVGIESGSQDVIDNALNKKLDLEIAKETLRVFEEEGIQQKCYFMIGIPGESKEQMVETVHFARDLDVDMVGFNVSMPLPQTGYYETCVKNDWLLAKDWSEFDERDTKNGGVFSKIRTDQWGPEYVQSVKQLIRREFSRSGWVFSDNLFADNALKQLRKIIKRVIKVDVHFPRSRLWFLLKYPYALFLKVLRGKKTRPALLRMMDWFQV